MAHPPLGLEEFGARLAVGRYTRLRQARQAIGGTNWVPKVRAHAERIAEAYFAGKPFGLPTPVEVDAPALLVTLEGLVAAVAVDPALAERVRSSLQALLSSGPSKKALPALKRKRPPAVAAPMSSVVPIAPPPQLDLSHVFDGEVKEEPDDDDEGEQAPEAPEVGGEVKGTLDLAAAHRACSPRLDIEKELESLEAGPLDENEKKVQRVMGRVFIQQRDGGLKGAKEKGRS